MKKRNVFLSLLICIAAAFFACGIFAISTTKDRGQTVTAEAATAIAPTIYWRYDSSNTTLSIGSAQLTGGTNRGSFSGDSVFNSSSNTPPWYNYSSQITLVNIETQIAPKSIAAWFLYCGRLTTVNNIDNIDTSMTVDMNNLFHDCSSLTSIDLSNFDTSNVEKMYAMFMGCSSLQSVNISNWNTSKVENFANMFNGCSFLTTIDVSSFDTSNATILGSMFKGCSSVTSIDVSGFDTSKVKRMGDLFSGCSSLRSLDLSGFNALSAESPDGTSNSGITDYFNGCTSLEKVKLSDSLAKRISADRNTQMPSMYYQDGTYCSSDSMVTKGGGYFKTPHTHSYPTITETKLPTCGEDGYDKYDCAELFCTLPKIITYSATGVHAWNSGTVTEESTCTKAGKKLFNCTACATTKTEDLPLSAHTYSTDWECDANNHWHECTVCNAVEPDSSAAHSWGTPVVTEQATEDNSGKQTLTCTVCDYEKEETIPALGHTHKFESGWTSDETNHWHASTCGHDVKDGEAAHAWNDGEITKEATCTAEGVKTFTCTVCSKTRTEAVDKIAHTEELDEAVEPDCINTGLTEGKHCSVCNYVIVAQQTKPALGHNYEAVEGGTPPTCTTAGSGKVVCTRCNDEKTGDSIPALGHNPGTAATCTESQTCTVCGTELAPALGHTSEVDEAVAPTCTETGLTAGTHCAVCGEVLTAQEEVPALGHSYEWVITKEATTEEAGLMENLCNVCGHKDGEQVIDKLEDPNGNGEIDLPIDVHVEFKVTQSSTDNDYSDIEKGLKRGYWAQLWYRNDDGTLGDEFTDKINCFLTLKIPTDIIEAIRGGEEINRDKIAAGLKVYYIDGDGAPVEVDNFTIAMRDDDSWQIKFNYNEKFRAEVVFAADLSEQPAPEPESGIPWWVWLIVGLVVVAIVGVVIVIIVVAKKKGDGNNGGDTEELKAQLAEQGEKIDELLGRDDGGFNTPVELDENGNVIFK